MFVLREELLSTPRSTTEIQRGVCGGDRAEACRGGELSGGGAGGVRVERAQDLADIVAADRAGVCSSVQECLGDESCVAAAVAGILSAGREDGFGAGEAAMVLRCI